MSAASPRRARVHVDDWDRHWDDYAVSAQRNPAQRFRRKLILSLLGASPDRVLDIGSGQGDLAADLVAAFPHAEVAGLELSASGVAHSRRKVPFAAFLQWDLLADRDPPVHFRCWATHAVCSEVLEHLDEPECLLRHVKAFLAPGCRLVVTVPGGPISGFDRHIGHRRHYTPEELRLLLERAGFQVECVHGAGYPFFNLYRRVVIARGSKLIADVARQPTLPARIAMRAFDAILLWSSRARGWQTVAVATLAG
ncbi:MAG TPA: class I SAM-dependent methyltransferase [Candidatus Acidoferrales bacterium]|nr:class I SAM-dependent methyltransferase [Candidatus Acidoferrales bacterium]